MRNCVFSNSSQITKLYYNINYTREYEMTVILVLLMIELIILDIQYNYLLTKVLQMQ